MKYDITHWLGKEAELANPQVFPAASLINPCSPQEAPHEFLTIQLFWLSYPTNKTPWSN